VNPASSITSASRVAIIGLAARALIPTVYSSAQSVEQGGLCAYGFYLPELTRLAASYVARLLGGAKVSDLPVHDPSRYLLAINLRTARELRIEFSAALQARADVAID
jgi:putative ABC transport system substrate-binding protein